MKQTKYLILILALGMFFTNAAFAQESASQMVKDQEISAKDLGVSNTGMLPGNPFYFLKELGRGVKSTFTFSSVKKADVQLGVVDERAAEIQKLKELLPASSKTLPKALDDYQKDLGVLKNKITALDNVSGQDVNDFLDKLSDHIIKQIKLFSELKDGVGDKIKSRLGELQDSAAEVLAEVPLKMETPNAFKCRLEKVIKDQGENALKEITISEVLDRLDDKISKETRVELLKLKENLIIRFQSRLQSGDFSSALSDILSQLPGDIVRKIKVLDEIREGISDADAKTKLNLARQEMLDNAFENKQIRKPEAEKMISEATAFFGDFQSAFNSTSTPKSTIISGLFSKAKFNLEQARQALGLDNYEQALGQASASLAASGAGLNYISKFNLSSGFCATDDIESLGEYHDEITAKMKELGLDKNISTTTQNMLLKSEQSIAKIADLAAKNTKADTIITLIKEAKLLLSQIDNSLNSK